MSLFFFYQTHGEGKRESNKGHPKLNEVYRRQLLGCELKCDVCHFLMHFSFLTFSNFFLH